MKISAFLLLMAPQIDGAAILYNSVLKDYIQRQMRDTRELFEEIDSAIRELPGDVVNMVKN